MNRGLLEVAGSVVSDGLADDPFPLTPALSLGERELRSGAGSWMRFMVPMHIGRMLKLPMRGYGVRLRWLLWLAA
jgi:hypothetical protein